MPIGRGRQEGAASELETGRTGGNHEQRRRHGNQPASPGRARRRPSVAEQALPVADITQALARVLLQACGEKRADAVGQRGEVGLFGDDGGERIADGLATAKE